MLLLVSLIIASCSSGSCDNTTATYTLGQLPNGATLYTNQSTFSSSSNGETTGTIWISGGSTTESYLLSFSESPVGPKITCSSSPCMINNTTNKQVQVNLSGNNSPAGQYTITVYYTSFLSQNKSQLPRDPLPNPILLNITGQPTPVAGSLSISSPLKTQLGVGESTIANIQLKDSQYLSGTVDVLVHSDSESIINVTPTVCHLTATTTCEVTIMGIKAGSSNFTASAVGYSSQTSESITVVPCNPCNSFITVGTYNGNLSSHCTDASCQNSPESAIKGADMICQNEAKLYNQRGVYKAVVLSSNRYPCDASGECGESHMQNWVIYANTPYKNLAESIIGISTTKYVLPDPSTYVPTYADGTIINKISDTVIFFMGISVGHVNDVKTDIDGWSPFNINGTVSGYTVNNCNDWTSDDNSLLGGCGYSSGWFITNSSADNWYAGWGNPSPSYVSNTWMNSSNACGSQLNLLCVQQ